MLPNHAVESFLHAKTDHSALAAASDPTIHHQKEAQGLFPCMANQSKGRNTADWMDRLAGR